MTFDEEKPDERRSDCGRVTVRAEPGAPPSIELRPDALRMEPDELAALITETAAGLGTPSTPDATMGVDTAVERLRALRDAMREGGQAAALRHGRESLGVPEPRPMPGLEFRTAPTKPVAGPPPGGEALEYALEVLTGLRDRSDVEAADLAGRAESRDGAIEVTARAGRPLAGLALRRHALGLGTEALALAIRETAREAAADLAEREDRHMAGLDVPMSRAEAAELTGRAQAAGRAAYAKASEIHASHELMLKRLHES